MTNTKKGHSFLHEQLSKIKDGEYIWLRNSDLKIEIMVKKEIEKGTQSLCIIRTMEEGYLSPNPLKEYSVDEESLEMIVDTVKNIKKKLVNPVECPKELEQIKNSAIMTSVGFEEMRVNYKNDMVKVIFGTVEGITYVQQAFEYKPNNILTKFKEELSKRLKEIPALTVSLDSDSGKYYIWQKFNSLSVIREVLKERMHPIIYFTFIAQGKEDTNLPFVCKAIESMSEVYQVEEEDTLDVAKRFSNGDIFDLVYERDATVKAIRESELTYFEDKNSGLTYINVIYKDPDEN